ncbi:unnamed protein product [Prorocentrum cordatum]|uniref:Tyr recombinase domain-containing protein n=1 Tax=Prorocentrum cordatum TaxID=2364126 RepID=A0ABN9QRZ8_9DINO|nr:unnamed protein product [Polarella glacialis]
MAHQAAGVPWQGDHDAILRGVRLVTVKGRTPRQPGQRVDKALMKALLRHAFPQGRVWWCLIAVLAYNFLLRMPSELFRQYRRGLLQVAGNRFLYGPIRRKKRQDFCTAFAFCLCSTDEALCLHTWLPLLDEQARASAGPPLGGLTPASWTREFRELLASVGVLRPEELYGYDIRRGAAKDVFAASGVEAMLSRGGWRSLASARSYVSGDEVAAGLLAQGVIDDSGPDN